MKQRLDYIDACRGLAIFTVVYSHICLFCLPGYDASAVIDFLRIYFLNAFFFISGFVVFRPRTNAKVNYISLVGGKFMQLLLPTFVVGAVYALTHHIGVTSFLLDGAKYGYWFTFVLFEMYLIYYIVSILSGGNVKIRMLMLALVATVLICCHKYGIYPDYLDNALCLGNLSYYFVFFACGYAVRACKQLIIRVLCVWGGVAVALMLAVVSLRNVIPFPSLLVNLACVCIVVYVVRSLYKDEPKMGVLSAIKRSLVFLGKYTLEIYFLHYFLLFPLPETIGRYFTDIAMTSKSHSFPELLVVGSIVMVICISCIIFSVFLKRIPYISLIAFGKTYKNEA